MLYVVVAAPPEVVTPADVERLPEAADLIEVRLDLLTDGSPEAVRPWCWLYGPGWPRRRAQPALATLRSAAEGGGFRGTPEQAAAALAQAALRWIDAEAPVAVQAAQGGPLGALVRERGRVALVLARHGSFARLRPPRGLPVAVVKRAAPVEDAAGLARYLEALREQPPRRGGRAVMPYGPLGALRVLDPHAALLYGSAGTAVVPGQPSLLALIDELRAGEVTPEARLFGLLGAPPARSPSPGLHNAVFRAQGLDAVHVPLPGLDLDAALSLPFTGYSVTTPFKARALAAAASADPRARAAGAANTLRRLPGGGWEAFNTDVTALETALAAARPGSTLAVHGAGGYARAALVAARALGLPAEVLARDEAAGRALARAFDVPFAGARFVRRAAHGALLNATPAGADGGSVDALGGDLRDLLVLDAPYAAQGRRTGLVEAARRGGAARVVDGLELLLGQALGQSACFAGASGAAAPDPDVLWLALRPCTSLVLIGLRGAGKTTVGRALARRLGRPFVDLDAEVERRTGATPAHLIRTAGVGVLRREERAAVRGLVGRRGLVVATGGGVVEHGKNLPCLAGLGPCVWLEVPPEVAAARVRADRRDRPALAPGESPLAEARRLLARRGPRYARLAAARVDAQGTVDEVVGRLVPLWLEAERRARGDRG